MATSAVGIVLGYTRSIPTKIAMLGIDLTLSDQQFLITVFQLVIFYFMAATYLHIGTDIYVLVSEEKMRDEATPLEMLRKTWRMFFKGALALGSYRSFHLKERAFFFSVLLILFELGLPSILALISIALLSRARVEPLLAMPLFQIGVLPAGSTPLIR